MRRAGSWARPGVAAGGNGGPQQHSSSIRRRPSTRFRGLEGHRRNLGKERASPRARGGARHGAPRQQEQGQGVRRQGRRAQG
eukprot:8659981-Pyramimonas_sp.AAC.1